MKAMLAVVVLLVAAPQARAGDEELADRLKKIEARLATLEAGLQAEEARKKVEARREAEKARRAPLLADIVKIAATRVAVKNVQPQKGVDQVEVMLKRAAAGDKRAVAYLAKLRKRIDRVLAVRGQAVIRLQLPQVGANWFGKKPADVAKRKELEAKLDALRAELEVQMRKLKELQAQEEQRTKAVR